MNPDSVPVILPLARAGLCLDCESLVTLASSCPRCASSSVVSVDAFLNREEKRWTNGNTG